MSYNNIRHAIRMIFLVMIVLLSCTRNSGKQKAAEIPDTSAIITTARRFTIMKTDSCTIVTVLNPWQGAKDINMVYYLVNRNSEIPCRVDPERTILVPLNKMVCMSTTHLAMVKALGAEKSIVGISGAGFVYDPVISEKVRKGIIRDIGYEAGLNNELIINLSPDLVMMYGIGGESAGYLGKIMELGVRVMFNADYLEDDPLGKAEWIKLFGALYCREDSALRIFEATRLQYNTTKEFIRQNCVTRPEVLLGLPFKDTWYISPGNSYISRLVADAGGDYLWKDTESSFSMPVGIENVYVKALKAEFWLNIGEVTSKADISAIDPRLESIPCYMNGNLYNNNKRVTPSGGNDYWESGTVNPQVILMDIAAVLHPELYGNYELFYYRKIE